MTQSIACANELLLVLTCVLAHAAQVLVSVADSLVPELVLVLTGLACLVADNVIQAGTTDKYNL